MDKSKQKPSLEELQNEIKKLQEEGKLEDHSKTESYVLNPEFSNLFSLPFDFFIWLRSSEFEELVKLIFDPILESRTGNKIRDDYKEKLLISFKVILLNLLSVHKHKAADCLAIPLNRNDVHPKTRYDLETISADAFLEAYKSLSKYGYINKLAKGQYGANGKKGYRTRIKPSLKLEILFDEYSKHPIVFFERSADEEIIILKSNKYEREGKLLQYEDTAETLKRRKNLQKINSVMQSHWYDLELSNEGFEHLRKLMKRRHIEQTKKSFFVNFLDRRLRRIFNDGSFDKGGRFYGGWWQNIPKEYRKHIRINEKLTVELDYSNMHPFILYARGNEQFEGDAYNISGFDRDVIKKTFNLMLNKKSMRKPKGYDPKEYDGYEWVDIKKAIITKHYKIEEFFGTGVGLELQNIDSQVAEKVLLYFKGHGCLPLHDSFIVHHALKDELQNVMIKAYKDILDGDVNINIDCKDYFTTYSISLAEQMGDSISNRTVEMEGDIFPKEYSEYYDRLRYWYSNKRS